MGERAAHGLQADILKEDQGQKTPYLQPTDVQPEGGMGDKNPPNTSLHHRVRNFYFTSVSISGLSTRRGRAKKTPKSASPRVHLSNGFTFVSRAYPLTRDATSRLSRPTLSFFFQQRHGPGVPRLLGPPASRGARISGRVAMRENPGYGCESSAPRKAEVTTCRPPGALARAGDPVSNTTIPADPAALIRRSYETTANLAFAHRNSFDEANHARKTPYRRQRAPREWRSQLQIIKSA